MWNDRTVPLFHYQHCHLGGLIMKRLLLFICSVFLILGLAGCGRIKTASELLKEAKKLHGDCELVSKEETDECTVIIVRDKLQGFEYRMSSGMQDISIDGSYFGSVPSTGDGFDEALAAYVKDSLKDRIDEYVSSTGAVVEDSPYTFFVVRSNDEDEAIEVALACAEMIQTMNLEHRMDGWQICAYANENENYLYDVRYGSIELPNISWRTIEQEKIEYYMEMAEMQLKTEVSFTGKVDGTFSQTGADIDMVEGSFYDDGQITDGSSPVTFYYFTTKEGDGYYICNFLYKDDNYESKWFIQKTD